MKNIFLSLLRPFLSQGTEIIIASRVDDCNALLSGLQNNNKIDFFPPILLTTAQHFFFSMSITVGPRPPSLNPPLGAKAQLKLAQKLQRIAKSDLNLSYEENSLKSSHRVAL